ncbi:MAG: Stk1 family PASTA domain-containing Ser/Thr kinase [Bacilli bacterium]|nr:Stk1 family PASTA domain-containing Ser/Thr kinase [Bacilli bacterium]
MKGQKINDRYQIIKTIGEGGMANVYLAYDTILDRNVAVKVLRGDLANDEKFVRRFQREALSASSLSHPNIVEVYDVGEDNGLYYIVMEYIEGKHLKQLLKKRGSLTVREVVDIMLQITDGMSAAHDSYIIHRDIKPQNIMILENGLIKITDFGIAMALNATQLTQTNSVMGSVHYLPPEQAIGKGATIQSDVYSMGILMYELLTGNVPYKGENAVEIALKHIKDTVPYIKLENNEIPSSVANVVKKSTAKNVKNRYQDAREMNEDLKTCLSDVRLDEEEYVFEFPEVEDDKKSKKTINDLENTSIIEDKVQEEKVVPKKKVEEEEIISKQITQEDVKSHENKLLLVLAIVFTSLIVIVTAIVFLLPKLTESPDIKIPDVSNLTVIEAENILEEAGFNVATETKDVTSDKIEVGKVVKTSPAALRTVKEGSTITLYISIGEGGYILEDLVGKNYISEKAILEKMYNLYVEVIEEEIEDLNKYEKGIIIRTEPEVGTLLKEGDTIKLYIPDSSVLYPDFTSGEYSLKDIENFAEKYSLNLTVEYVETNEYEVGEIFEQSRDAGDIVTEGHTLKIFIAEYLDEENLGE